MALEYSVKFVLIDLEAIRPARSINQSALTSCSRITRDVWSVVTVCCGCSGTFCEMFADRHVPRFEMKLTVSRRQAVVADMEVLVRLRLLCLCGVAGADPGVCGTGDG